MTASIRAIQADITTLTLDAIVNAANTSLLGGGGVDGAIHRAAGPKLLRECRTLHGCVTPATRRSRSAIACRHAMSFTPWAQSGTAAPTANQSCSPVATAARWKLATQHSIETIAFPSISTGVFGYPIEKAIAHRSDDDQDRAAQSRGNPRSRVLLLFRRRPAALRKIARSESAMKSVYVLLALSLVAPVRERVNA
jgi:O-acetyl-ADP-ribose deacetylase (regulator of RNase III)